MKKPKIQTVCGFGCGSSLMLKMKIDTVLRDRDLEADVFCGDVGTALANPCDAIFISRDLADNIRERSKVPIIVIDNFMNSKEVEAKVLDYFSQINE